MVRLVRQRARWDCGVAALATLLSGSDHTYETIAAMAPRGGQCGMRTHELVATALRLGIALTAVRAYDLDVDAGVLRVRAHGYHRDGHMVAVRYGLIWDVLNGTARPWRDYAATYRARFGVLARL